jgi:hypothetical protein
MKLRPRSLSIDADKTPAGVAAISRRLSAATPPVGDTKIERAEPGGFAAIERCDPVGVDYPAASITRWYRRSRSSTTG